MEKPNTLIISLAAYEQLREKPDVDQIIIVDRQLPPTLCKRLAYGEWVVGGIQFAIELSRGIVIKKGIF